MTGGNMHKDMRITFLLAVGKFPNTVSGLMQWALHSVEGWCGEHGLSVNLDKNGLVAFTRRRKLPGFFKPTVWGNPAMLQVDKVSRSDPGCPADLEGAHGG
jgi:hypothetical protein